MRKTTSGTPPEKDFLPGDIVLVPFPFTDLSAAKSRPGLVLSDGAFNAAGDDVILCAVTSNLANSAASVLLSDEDLESGHLPRPSRVKVGKVVTLQKGIIRKRLGRVDQATFRRIMKEFESIFP